MTLQILHNVPATLELRVYNSGVLTDLDANPTVILTDGNGDAVTTGAVTKPGAPDAVGVYRSALPGQANLKVFDAEWSGLLGAVPVTFDQDYEIVGNQLFTEADARTIAIVGGQAALADETRYPDAVLAGWRATIGDIFESRLNRSMIRRYCRVRLRGWGTQLDLTYGYPMLASGTQLERPGRPWDVSRIISATVGGTAQTVGDLEIVGSKIQHTTGSWNGSTTTDPLNVTVEYEYGPDPVWPEAHQRALELLLANAAPKGYPSSATSISNEDGTFRITTFPAAVEDFLSDRKHRRGFGLA